MSWYSQNDPQWKNSTLGSNPEGTIGEYGCYLTAFANMTKLSGSEINPPNLNAELVNAGCFNPDDTLKNDWVMDGRHQLQYVGTHATPNVLVAADYAYLEDAQTEQFAVEIDAFPQEAGIQTHFVLWYDGHDAASIRVVDSWDGTVKYLKAYGDPNVIIQKFVHYRVVVPAPAPAAPQPTPETTTTTTAAPSTTTTTTQVPVTTTTSTQTSPAPTPEPSTPPQTTTTTTQVPSQPEPSPSQPSDNANGSTITVKVSFWQAVWNWLVALFSVK